MTLSDKQIRHLRSLAHHLKPVVRVGQHGVHDTVLEELAQALDAHELIKVKIVADKAGRREIIDRLVAASGATLVQHIGQMAVFFRRNNKKPKIALPSK
ncbi:ribosome assembly RNA-binding protein YhbY [endosymbiont of unidentified scaly snail isolate Monju]|uniref:ribosome assembly RNA-binding protein YhbY n=1 Tax=endosymbiont of unidentified scaly snail isolate Monju TaxID=1248727 RepID=UPI000389237A|nr:ribosome assembly RNA-binding protein YhbY [endosymbiont of unidentified scaly snail isolate Monju]BAN69397.1 RNA-binding protein [endosymbiont of unidentified scaly snail isolate Monju]